MDQIPEGLLVVLEAAVNLDPSSRQQVHKEGACGSGLGVADPCVATTLAEANENRSNEDVISDSFELTSTVVL
ncbi:unnamed protein product [Caretta caretta]